MFSPHSIPPEGHTIIYFAFPYFRFPGHNYFHFSLPRPGLQTQKYHRTPTHFRATPAFSNTFSRSQGGALGGTRPSHHVPRSPSEGRKNATVAHVAAKEPNPPHPSPSVSGPPGSLAQTCRNDQHPASPSSGRTRRTGSGRPGAGLGRALLGGAAAGGRGRRRAPPLYSRGAGGRSTSGSARRRGGDAEEAVIVRLCAAGRCLTRLWRCQFVWLPLSPSLPAADGGGCGGRGLAFRGRAAPG